VQGAEINKTIRRTEVARSRTSLGYPKLPKRNRGREEEKVKSRARRTKETTRQNKIDKEAQARRGSKLQ